MTVFTSELSPWRIVLSCIVIFALLSVCIIESLYTDDERALIEEGGVKGQRELLVDFIDDTAALILVGFFNMCIGGQLIVFFHVIILAYEKFIDLCRSKEEGEEAKEEENVLLDADIALANKTPDYLPPIECLQH